MTIWHSFYSNKNIYNYWKYIHNNSIDKNNKSEFIPFIGYNKDFFDIVFKNSHIKSISFIKRKRTKANINCINKIVQINE